MIFPHFMNLRNNILPLDIRGSACEGLHKNPIFWKETKIHNNGSDSPVTNFIGVEQTNVAQKI